MDILDKIINESIQMSLNEVHLKVVDNIDAVCDMIESQWTSPDDAWWIKIDSRRKDFKKYNMRHPNGPSKWWSRVPGPDGTSRENHVGYVIVRGVTKEDAVKSIKDAVVHLHPWAARQAGAKTMYSNGNAEAIKQACHLFMARAYIVVNKRSLESALRISRIDKAKGRFGGRAFHNRMGQMRTGQDRSGVNWTVLRPYGLIDCDVDNPTAQAELERYLNKNGVKWIMKRPSHDGMHYIIRIDDAKGLNFNFMNKYSSGNRRGDPNVLFKPDANIILYSAVG